MSRRWMLICNPRIWNVQQFFDDGHTEGIWRANRCEMKVGDHALLRVAQYKGMPVSVYAFAEIIGRPDLRDEIDSVSVQPTNQYWQSGEEPNPDDLFVPLRYTKILHQNPLPVDVIGRIGRDPKLFRAPQSSCTELKLLTFDALRDAADKM